MRIRLERLAPKIWLMLFPGRKQMARALLRFSEHDESPRFRGKVFTYQEYKDWYIQENGSFSYADDWSGFNIIVRDLRPFRDGLFDPLAPEERRVLRLCRRLPADACVIALAVRSRHDRTLLEHELAHGLYATDPEYRRRVRAAMDGLDLDKARRELREDGYHRAVVDDEIHAYTASGDRDYAGWMPAKACRRLRDILRDTMARTGIIL